MNLKTVADAIAARFTGVTATVGSVTESIAFGPTASLPNSLAKGPALLVFHPEGALSMTMGHALDTYDFPVRLLRDPLNYPDRSDWLYAWATALRPKLWQQFTLGIAGVTEAAATAMDVRLDGYRYGDTPYDMVEVTVRVQVYEQAAGVAS